MPKKLGDLVLYSVDDLHQELGISKMTIRAYLREGRLKGKKFGVSWFVTEKALKEFFLGDQNERVQEQSKDTSSNSSNITDEQFKVESLTEIAPLSKYTYIVQGINDLVSESEECETIEEVITVLEEQAIISLFQVSTIRKKDGKLIEVLKAREFLEKYK